LWDLATWSEVDVVVDERLPCKSDGRLLGCTPSVDGELWVCYLEKALAVHCGGWDKIDGGQCTHAWALLTGCKEQYTMQKTDKGAYKCLGKYNPNEDRWEEHANSPHEGFSGLWPMAWPEAGGGGARDLELSMEDLFARMCVWDDKNYIMGAGTKSGSDSEKTDGIVDGRAYSVLQCEDDVAGTGVDLIQMRNPWGKGGELENSEWTDDGAGWQRYPAVKAILNPVLADDGIFWVSKDEFFKYFQTLYLSASDMTAFLSDHVDVPAPDTPTPAVIAVAAPPADAPAADATADADAPSAGSRKSRLANGKKQPTLLKAPARPPLRAKGKGKGKAAAAEQTEPEANPAPPPV